MERKRKLIVFIALFLVIAIIAILLIALNTSKDKEKIAERLPEETIITKVETPIKPIEPILEEPIDDTKIAIPAKPNLIISLHTLSPKEDTFSIERSLSFDSININIVYDNERITFIYPKEIPTDDVIDLLISISSLLSLSNLDYIIEDGIVEIEHYGIYEKEEIEETLDKLQAYFDSLYPKQANEINLMGYSFTFEINDEYAIITGINGIDQEIASDYIVSLYSSYRNEMKDIDFEIGDDYIMALYPEEYKDNVSLFIESLR